MNWIKKNASECPKCKTRVIKGPEIQHNRVRCPTCNYGDFCYGCLLPWKNNGFKICGNPSCNYLKKFLENTPFDKIFNLRKNG